ncbi:hypothetical protein [Luteitalea sp.]
MRRLGPLVVALAVACAAWPAGMAVAVVLLCAGPHNWCEARYFLARMPARWGPLRPYVLAGGGGVALLAASFIALAVATTRGQASTDAAWLALSAWHTALVVWVALLVTLRQRLPHAPNWGWMVPPALVFLAVAWAVPLWASVVLVYLHPLLALVFLDRELAVRRVPWHGAYRATLACVPWLVVALWWTTATPSAAAVTSPPELAQAGAFLLPAGAAAAVLATHVFLESLHYLVWIVGIPLVTAAAPWHLRHVPLAMRSRGWRRILAVVLGVGAAAVGVLWIAFAVDYETTRQVYFTVAIVHVLAEVPFLIRLA